MSKKTPDSHNFSTEERAELREALLQYMKDHKIGVPTLQKRIAKATGRPDAKYVPRKTLQRFLADTSRTGDYLLTECSKFLDTIKPPKIAERFSEAASAYFQLANTPNLAHALAGTWEGKATGNKKGMVVFNPTTGRELNTFAVSTLTIQPAAHDHSLKILETVINPEANRKARYDPGFQHTYNGVLLPFPKLICIFLKNTITNLPRTYWLKFEDDTLWGHGTEGVPGATYQLVSDLEPFTFKRNGKAVSHD